MSKIEKENMDRNFRSYDDDKEVEEEGFSSNAQRKAAFASGYKAKGKKGKKSESVKEASNTYSPKGYAKAVADKVMSIDKALKQSKIPFTLLFKLIKKYDRTFKFESVNEAKEPDVIIQLRKIVKDRQNALVIDTKSKKKVRVDMQSANLIVQVYDALKQQSNKNKFVKGGIAMMGHTAFKLMKRENVNEAYVVLHSPKKGVKPVATAAYANKKDAQKWAKDLGGITMIVQKNIRGLEESVNEASIKGKNNKTGESFGMVIGSDKKNKQGEFEVTIRITYSSRISSYKFMFDKSSNLIAIKDYGYSMDGKFPDMSGRGSVKDVRPNPRETITQIAKVTSPAFAKKIVQHVKKVNESVNEAKAKYPNFDLDKNIRYQSTSISSGMWRYTGKEQGGKGVYRNLNNGQFLGFSSDDFKYFKKHLKRHFDIDESINEACWDTHKQVGMKTKGGKQVPNCVPKGESVVKEDKNQIIQLKKKVGKSEIKFYDALSKIEKKLGKKSYRKFIEKGLSDFKINPKHYDYRSNGAAEEKLFNLAK